MKNREMSNLKGEPATAREAGAAQQEGETAREPIADSYTRPNRKHIGSGGRAKVVDPNETSKSLHIKRSS